jgi:hypothetical protein
MNQVGVCGWWGNTILLFSYWSRHGTACSGAKGAYSREDEGKTYAAE